MFMTKNIILYCSFFLLIGFSIISCSSTQKGKITLGINDTYSLVDTEKESSNKNAKHALTYNSLFNHYEKAQIPLHKYVKGDNYEMYFGIPIGYNRAGYYYTFMKDSNFTLLSKNADENKYYNKLLRKTDSLYISTEIIENIQKASYYIVHISGKDSASITNKYEQDYAFKKLHFK